MSHVCDGQYDYGRRDDEVVCPITSCPGLFKCLGENRCVSKEEICDNHINCLYSMDDEIECYKCPGACEFNGYSVECNVENTLQDVSPIGINNISGLTLTGVQQKVHVHNLHVRDLIYINASLCQMEKILISHQNNLNIFVLIVDFRHNILKEIHFLSADVFKNILFLDLSFNYLTTFKYDTLFVLTKLFMLSIADNPIKDKRNNNEHEPS